MSMTIYQITEGLLSGFMLGLSTGPLCMGSCLPVLLPFSFNDTSAGSDKNFILKFLGQFLAGRFVSYILVGLGVGYIGSIFNSSILNKITLIIMIFLAGLLIAYGLGVRLSSRGLCQSAHKYANSKRFPIILGVLTGINVCAPFLLAIFYSFERSTTPMFGVIFFMAFFISTSLYLFPIVLVKYLPKGNYLNKISQITALCAGSYFIYKGASMLSVFTS